MDILITGIHLDTTEAIKNYVEEKVGKIGKYLENISTVKVNLEVLKTKSEGEIHKAKAIIHAAGHDIIIDSEDKNLYAAIDILADKLERQVRKLKEKMKNRD